VHLRLSRSLAGSFMGNEVLGGGSTAGRKAVGAVCEMICDLDHMAIGLQLIALTLDSVSCERKSRFEISISIHLPQTQTVL